MFPTLQIGPLALPIPGLALILGAWLGITLAERHAHSYGVDPAQLVNLTGLALVAGVVGARLAYVIAYPSAFAGSPASLVSLNPGLLDPAGGAAAALLVGLVYAQRKSIGIGRLLDALTPVLAVMALALGISHLASGAAFGVPTSLPWGIELWGARRHPTQVYEILAALAILIAVRPGRKTPARSQGTDFLVFLALSAAARLVLEGFRGDNLLLYGGLRAAQLAAWAVLGFCLLALSRMRAQEPNVQGEEETPER